MLTTSYRACFFPFISSLRSSVSSRFLSSLLSLPFPHPFLLSLRPFSAA
ncbi:Protein of unknown function [Pyronema omphalodes CBS 100304]|uniref:Uncharacterized protein n=1 Tax=Pyronema omphalodes (strain CBS 100304) TaxID=1076935 RepID=U4LFV1_PYROM|nr:Protein of unknown function [Pyronema omphalodes CBS 100304]